MAQVQVNNATVMQHEMLFLTDKNASLILSLVVKGTFDLLPKSEEGIECELKFAEQQRPVNLDGEYVAQPESSSYLYEPETAYTKPTTDIVVIGDAVSGRGPVRALTVDIKVGQLQKKLMVFGDRQWIKQSSSYRISTPEPFESLPLIYENAFGGWDRRDSDESNHHFEARNSVGKGFYHPEVTKKNIDSELPLYLPNIENPEQLIQKITDTPEPAGCGFTLPHWQPRVTLAGTYDEQWLTTKSPLLPDDFRSDFFNAASPGLIAPKYLCGDEKVQISNMTRNGLLIFELPKLNPYCSIELTDSDNPMPLLLDTVIINLKNQQVELIWRNYLTVLGTHSVQSVDISYTNKFDI
ncbi:DUF2169 family type VI secretion system accessory protein [Aliikangiella maris]|uniref:DUF2169 domain-containing protein n=2 Tax=Aliikangiella maris TaxID=3162458 RepID=A0ABV3MNB2_9GAMM